MSGNNNPDGAGDVQEGFEFGWELIQGKSEARSEDGIMAGENKWPSESDVPGFRNTALQY
jgi:isopenicillin N synthase-like dioxygenase